MKRFLIVFFAALLIISCRKRNGEFEFAGVWEIEKVEQVNYVNGNISHDTLIKSDTIGWFIFYNGISGYSPAQMLINFNSISGLSTDNDGTWVIDEHEGERVWLNKFIYTRQRVFGGEKWTWVNLPNSGNAYSRETIYVKKK